MRINFQLKNKERKRLKSLTIWESSHFTYILFSILFPLQIKKKMQTVLFSVINMGAELYHSVLLETHLHGNHQGYQRKGDIIDHHTLHLYSDIFFTNLIFIHLARTSSVWSCLPSHLFLLIGEKDAQIFQSEVFVFPQSVVVSLFLNLANIKPF